MPAPTRIAFGPFELEPDNFRLTRSGTVVQIERIPLEILFILAENRGRLVSRAEIVERIWGKDVFLDAESAVNTAVRKLRRALGDDAVRPEYVETVPAKGYRLIARIESVAGETSEAHRMRLAVLPFDSFSDEPLHGYFADGMTEEIIAQLGSLCPDLAVIARTSVMAYKRTSRSVQQIGRELDVQLVLEGSLRFEGPRVRVTAQLIETAAQSHRWAESFERPLDDILDLQRNLAHQISRRIRMELNIPARRVVASSGANPAAYAAFVKGRFFWNKKSPAGFARAIEHFEEAVRIDSGFAAAYTGLADCYILLGIHGLRVSRDVYTRAEEAALAALALDPDSAEAHTSLADIRKGYHWDWTGAETEFRRAIELNPSYAVAHQWYAELLSTLGRSEEAIREVEIARRLDPLSVSINAFVGYMLYRVREFARAEREIVQAIELDPNLPVPHWFLGKVCDALGDGGRAVHEFREATRLSDRAPMYLATLAFGLARTGQAEEARAIRVELAGKGEAGYVSPVDLAIVFTGLNESGRAFEELERACGERVARVRELREPIFDSLHSDARFAELLARIGLPPPTVSHATGSRS